MPRWPLRSPFLVWVKSYLVTVAKSERCEVGEEEAKKGEGGGNFDFDGARLFGVWAAGGLLVASR